MDQHFSPVLFPPLLLAMDGSPGARRAQKMICAIAQLMQAPSADPTNEQSAAVLSVLAVNPRQQRRLRNGGKLGNPLRASVAVVDRPADAANTLTQAPESVPTLMTTEQLSDFVHQDLPVTFPVMLEVRQGRPTVEILSYAHTLQAGLIAVGHRGRGGVRELLLGSVSTAIARYAPCSVLVVRGQATEIPDPEFAHLLVVVDTSPVSQYAIATARQLAQLGLQHVTLLYIQAPLNANHLVGPFTSHTPNWHLEQSLQAAQREQSETYLHQATAAFAGLDVTVQTICRTGDPGPIICQLAAEQGSDLILLGSDPTRRSLLSHLPVRSQSPSPKPMPQAPHRSILRNTRLSVTEDYTIHYAPCPVLLCRSQLTITTQPISSIQAETSD